MQMDVQEDGRRVMGGLSQEAGSEVCLMACIVFWVTENLTTRTLFYISLCMCLWDSNSALFDLIVCLSFLGIYIF